MRFSSVGPRWALMAVVCLLAAAPSAHAGFMYYYLDLPGQPSAGLMVVNASNTGASVDVFVDTSGGGSFPSFISVFGGLVFGTPFPPFEDYNGTPYFSSPCCGGTQFVGPLSGVWTLDQTAGNGGSSG